MQAHLAQLSLGDIFEALEMHQDQADLQAKGLVALGVLGQVRGCASSTHMLAILPYTIAATTCIPADFGCPKQCSIWRAGTHPTLGSCSEKHRSGQPSLQLGCREMTPSTTPFAACSCR